MLLQRIFRRENYTNMDNQKIQEKLKQILKPGRYEHTIGVMHTAAALAMCWGGDISNALTAGLLHDCGKFGSDEEQVNRCLASDVKLTESEIRVPALVHAKLGAYYAETVYNIADDRILNAIRYHTTGRSNMSLLEKIIFLADYIEPHRKEIPGLDEIRKMAFQNIDKAVCMAAYNTIRYLESIGQEIEPATIETYEYYKQF